MSASKARMVDGVRRQADSRGDNGFRGEASGDDTTASGAAPNTSTWQNNSRIEGGEGDR